MGLIISTKEIDKILKESKAKQSETEEIRILPFKKQILCPTNMFIASTIVNSHCSDTSEIFSSKQEKANLNEYPMNCIGKLKVSFPNNLVINSTCSIISSNKILTLVSNIYHPKEGRATKIILSHRNQNYVLVSNGILFPLYEENKLNKNNYIILSFKDLSAQNWFGIECPKIDSLYKREVNLAGFIAELDGFYNSNGKILKHNNNTIKYAIECFAGQEGSPLFIKANVNNGSIHTIDIDNDNSAGANIIGLHCFSSSEEEKEGCGNVINPQVFDWIKDVLEEEKSTLEDNVIQRLDFSNRGFGPGEIEYLIYFQLIHLREIDLTHNKIKAQGAYFLSQGHYPNLSKLSLNNNEIGDLGVKYLSKAGFVSLTELRLFNNHLTHKAVEDLSASYFCLKLQLLDLSENPKIKDKGVKIFETTNWASLTEIYLHCVGMTDKSIRALRRIKTKYLKKVVVTGNKFTNRIDHVIHSLKSTDIMIECD